jgi:hypothetical protein
MYISMSHRVRSMRREDASTLHWWRRVRDRYPCAAQLKHGIPIGGTKIDHVNLLASIILL